MPENEKKKLTATQKGKPCPPVEPTRKTKQPDQPKKER